MCGLERPIQAAGRSAPPPRTACNFQYPVLIGLMSDKLHEEILCVDFSLVFNKDHLHLTNNITKPYQYGALRITCSTGGGVDLPYRPFYATQLLEIEILCTEYVFKEIPK